MTDHQLIVIGSGPGGYEAALRAAELGIKTALVEKRDIGGTCLNRGCIPTKALLHASEFAVQTRQAARYGIPMTVGPIDAGKLFAEKNAISATLRQGVEGLLEQAEVTVYRGVGTVQQGGIVNVTGENGTVTLTAEHILLATGAVPAKPPIPGLDLKGVVTSDELLEGDDHIYGSLVIIGGGVIGVELATCYSDLGCRVTVIEGLSRLLPNMDRELGQNLSAILKKRGVSVAVGCKVTGVAAGSGGELCVSYQNGAETKTVSGERVLCAIGRVPNLENLLADGLSLEMDGRRIKVNERFETSLPGVFAIGDVSSPIQLAHVATAQGRGCVDMLAGLPFVTEMSVIPSCVYCSPEIACVGMTLEEAQRAGLEAETGKSVLFSNGRTLIQGAPRSFIKIVAERGSRRILGAQLMCERASDMLSEFTVAIVGRLTPERLLSAVRAHPTFEEAVTDALRDVAGKLDRKAL